MRKMGCVFWMKWKISSRGTRGPDVDKAQDFTSNTVTANTKADRKVANHHENRVFLRSKAPPEKTARFS